MKEKIGEAIARLAMVKRSGSPDRYWKESTTDWGLLYQRIGNYLKVITGCRCNLMQGSCHCSAGLSDLMQETLKRINDEVLPNINKLTNVDSYIKTVARHVYFDSRAAVAAQKRGGKKGENGKNKPPQLIPYHEQDDQNCSGLDVFTKPRQLKSASVSEFVETIHRLHRDHEITGKDIALFEDLLEEWTQREIAERKDMNLRAVNDRCKMLREIMRRNLR